MFDRSGGDDIWVMSALEPFSEAHRVTFNDGDDTVYELEALEPEDMLKDLEKVVQSVLDIVLFNREAAVEQEEAAELAAIRKVAAKALKGI